MKRSLVFILVVSLVLSFAGTALAFPVDFTGDFRLQARSIDDGVTGYEFKGSWFQLRTRLNFTGQIDKDTVFFGRISSRNNFGGANTGGGTEFDHYGVKISAADWKFSLGRQGVTLGMGTIIDTGYDAIGCTPRFDGLIATTKMGKADVKIIGGKNTIDGIDVTTWNSIFLTPQEIYGFDISGRMGDNFTMGVAWAQSNINQNWSHRNWAVNFKYDASEKFSLFGEYTKRDWLSTHFPGLNTAWFMAAQYNQGPDSFTLQYNRVGGEAVNPFWSGIGAAAYPFYGSGSALGWPSYKGFTFAYNHQVNKALSYHVIYMDLQPASMSGIPALTGNDKELAVGAVWKF